jgi:predicted XRE-type DNA-binding protein
MKHAEETEQLFQKVIDDTPPAIKQQVEWSYDIADYIDASLQQRGMSQKEFAKLIGTSEAAVSHWVGGGHNFTLSTLAKISAALGSPIIQVTRVKGV